MPKSKKQHACNRVSRRGRKKRRSLSKSSVSTTSSTTTTNRTGSRRSSRSSRSYSTASSRRRGGGDIKQRRSDSSDSSDSSDNSSCYSSSDDDSPARSQTWYDDPDPHDLAELELKLKADHARARVIMRRDLVNESLILRFLGHHINVERDVEPIDDAADLMYLTKALCSYVRMEPTLKSLFSLTKNESTAVSSSSMASAWYAKESAVSNIAPHYRALYATKPAVRDDEKRASVLRSNTQ